MKMKDIGKYVAMILVFGATGLTLFTRNVRVVDVLGLFASGAVVGIFVERIIVALRTKQEPK